MPIIINTDTYLLHSDGWAANWVEDVILSRGELRSGWIDYNPRDLPVPLEYDPARYHPQRLVDYQSIKNACTSYAGY